MTCRYVVQVHVEVIKCTRLKQTLQGAIRKKITYFVPVFCCRFLIKLSIKSAANCITQKQLQNILEIFGIHCMSDIKNHEVILHSFVALVQL